MAAKVLESVGEPTTIVVCVEKGRLEPQTLLLLESLRRWGGPIGQSRVLAVMPRRDRGLSPGVAGRLKDLGAEVVDGSAYNRLPWYNYYGKAVAARIAEEMATTPVVTWLDSDALVVGPLVELGLPHGDDFTARREFLPPAVREHDRQEYLPFWRHACESAGLSWSDVPWLPADGDLAPQCLSLNSGAYAFRRGTGLVDAYEDIMRRLIADGVAYDGDTFWTIEQVALGLAVVRLGLRWRELPLSENHMIFQEMIDGPVAAPSAAEARVIHYSQSMDPTYYGRFLERIRRDRPDLFPWLRDHGPIVNERAKVGPIHFTRKAYRGLRMRAHRWKCRRAGRRRAT